MMLLTDSETARILTAICVVGALVWIWFEWRRENRRQWPLRVIAALLASGALAALGIRPAAISDSNPLPPAPEDAALWTRGGITDTPVPVPRGISPDRRFALPGASNQPAGSLVIPDVAFLQREYPNIRKLHIFGDGVEAADAAVLRNVRVIFHPPPKSQPGPAITFARLPVQANLGEPILVQGRVEGLAASTHPVLAATSPDGATTHATLEAASAGIATFSLALPPAVTTGRFVWPMELRSSPDGRVLAREVIGVSIEKPKLPRILVLESSPRFDTGRIQRWLGDQGARLTIRTQLGRDRFRITATPNSRAEVETLEPDTLAEFDLVMPDASVIAQLTEAEREALRSAIRDEGLGLLMVADESILGADPSLDAVPRDEFLFPWKTRRDAAAAAGEDRVSRLRWAGAALSPEPLPVPPMEISRDASMQPLVTDGQDRVLAGAVARGRGRIAFSLVRQTWRWAQLADSAAFAAYWSFLFSGLSRHDSSTGQWSIVNNNAGPSFVNAPMKLRWTGSPDRAPLPAEITFEGIASPERLPLAQSPVNPSQWESIYWPRQPGWHQVRAGSGATLDVYVSGSDGWLALQAARRQSATAQIAASSAAADLSPPAASPAPAEWLRWPFFALLLASLTYLWFESRTARLKPKLYQASSPLTNNQ